MAAKVIQFVSRARLLQHRGHRNYSRYMLIVKGFVAGDSLERAQWHKEDAEESQRDAVWNRRHGPVGGGASVLQWRHEPDVGMPGEQPPRRNATTDEVSG
jgi:hypothetical protein